MAKQGGFNPDRLGEPTRPEPVVPRILETTPTVAQARGFTEVRIVGVGGGGGNAVNRMIEADVRGVEFIAVNTDAQALAQSHALRRICIGSGTTRGLGAGGDPFQGERAAQASEGELREAVAGADMVFITAGMGGGTGTGAAPVVAGLAREEGALTVAVVTLPFAFEGSRRRRSAEGGLQALREHVDALIVIPNDRLMRLSDGHLPMVEAFRLADDVLRQGVQGIADLVTYTGLINLDFADVKSVMTDAGTALMAVGEARGDSRALQAAHAAINSPLLDASIAGARGVLINITGGPDLTLTEVSEAANAIYEVVDPGANILVGAVVHPRPQPEVKLTLIATGLPGTDSVPARESRDRRAAPPARERDAGYERERDRERDWDHDWDRDRERDWDREPPLAEAPDEDDLDLPAFLRRRRQR
ncbi:MAG TPA: cell division protein FtsZ [Chloroflexota bacterium]|nr:cell division protein FtsZ [Chloroflexota bacterium]